jgi:hypothetical protein
MPNPYRKLAFGVKGKGAQGLTVNISITREVLCVFKS